MKRHDIAEQIRIGSLPREANGGEIGNCNFPAEAGLKENAERSYSTATLFARLRGGLAARCVSLRTSGQNSENSESYGPRRATGRRTAHNAYCESLSCASGEPL